VPASYQQRLRAQQRKEAMAELVSEGLRVSAASRQIGISQQGGSRLWREIVAEMGAQAI
jgi:hypothetical protein